MNKARIQYGIWIPTGQVLDPGWDLDTQERRLRRYRDMWPDAQVVSREVRYTPWVSVPLDQLKRTGK